MAQQGSRVPKFGNWESEENVPYTAYFDKARKVRTSGGKPINPNDPEDNPDLYSDYGAPSQAPPSKPKPEPEEPIGRSPARQTREQLRSREDGEFKQFVESPALHDNKSHGSRGANETSKQPGRSYAGSENSNFEKSPMHPQARTLGRGVGGPSPLWEGNKGSSYDGTGRSRPRPNPIGNESPDKGAAVPKFGDWDENNPASADGYTHIFNKVREERNYAGRVPSPRTPSHSNARNSPPSDSTKCCCFPWGGK